jgi:hypothetical protein
LSWNNRIDAFRHREPPPGGVAVQWTCGASCTERLNFFTARAARNGEFTVFE